MEDLMVKTEVNHIPRHLCRLRSRANVVGKRFQNLITEGRCLDCAEENITVTLLEEWPEILNLCALLNIFEYNL